MHCVFLQRSYSEALIPHVAVFRDGASKDIIQLNEAIRVGP